MSSLRVVLIAACLFAGDSWCQAAAPPAQPGKPGDDVKALEGRWKVVKLAGEDTAVVEGVLGRPFVMIKGGRLTLFVAKDGRDQKCVEYTYTVDAKRTPARIDLKIEYLAWQTKRSMARAKGQVERSIYELKGDRLRIQRCGDGRGRLGKLREKDDGLVLVREKK